VITIHNTSVPDGQTDEHHGNSATIRSMRHLALKPYDVIATEWVSNLNEIWLSRSLLYVAMLIQNHTLLTIMWRKIETRSRITTWQPSVLKSESICMICYLSYGLR